MFKKEIKNDMRPSETRRFLLKTNASTNLMGIIEKENKNDV